MLEQCITYIWPPMYRLCHSLDWPLCIFSTCYSSGGYVADVKVFLSKQNIQNSLKHVPAALYLPFLAVCGVILPSTHIGPANLKMRLILTLTLTISRSISLVWSKGWNTLLAQYAIDCLPLRFTSIKPATHEAELLERPQLRSTLKINNWSSIPTLYFGSSSIFSGTYTSFVPNR